MARHGIEAITAPAGVIDPAFRAGMADVGVHLPANRAVTFRLTLGHHQAVRLVCGRTALKTVVANRVNRLSSCVVTTRPRRSLPLVSVTSLSVLFACGLAAAAASAADSGVAVLLVDTDRVSGTIDERIYGQFLEHINHSVVDGLYAEQIRGQGFEGKDFADYWTPFAERRGHPGGNGFEQGENSVRLAARDGAAGIRQGRVYLEAGQRYDGSLWLNPERGTLAVSLRILSSSGFELAKQRLKTTARDGRRSPSSSRARPPTGRHRSRSSPPEPAPCSWTSSRSCARTCATAACCGRTSWRHSGDWRPRSSAGPAVRTPPSTSGRTASARGLARSTTPTRSGAATPTTTASARTSSWSSAGSSGPSPLIVLAATGTTPHRSSTRWTGCTT